MFIKRSLVQISYFPELEAKAVEKTIKELSNFSNLKLLTSFELFLE
jgi:hypothetical protein